MVTSDSRPAALSVARKVGISPGSVGDATVSSRPQRTGTTFPLPLSPLRPLVQTKNSATTVTLPQYAPDTSQRHHTSPQGIRFHLEAHTAYRGTALPNRHYTIGKVISAKCGLWEI